MTSYNCEFCNTGFSRKNALAHHKKTAKYCLIRQGFITEEPEQISIDKFKCEYCSKIFTTKFNVNVHMTTCHIKNENIEADKDKKIQELLYENIELKNIEKNLKLLQEQFQEQRNNYERQITELKIQNEKLQDTIASIASQPKTIQTTNNHNNTTKTNNNNRVNIINNLAPMTDDEYKKLGDMLQRSHLERGVDGFADLAIQFFQGKVICTDLSRRMVTHKDSEGRVVSDPNMTRLTTKFFGGLMDKNRELTCEIIAELQKRLEDKEIDYEEFMNILVRFSGQKFTVRKLADGDDKNEEIDDKGEYLQFKNSYVNKVCDKIYVKNN